MIQKYLDEVIIHLEKLIDITSIDIENIKNADHSMIDSHTTIKKDIIKNFEETKSLLDKELISLSKNNPNTDLSDLLDDATKEKLAQLRESLLSLQSINKQYAKSVIVIKEFYDSLLKAMFGNDTSSYTHSKLSPEQIFKLRV